MKKKTVKKPVRRAPAKTHARKSVALVKAKPAVPAVVEAQLMSPQYEGRIVTDGFRLDALGLVELKATKAEEKVLAREPAVIDVMVLPNNGAPYLPHPVLTFWLNEAFGRGAWVLAAVGKPAIIENVVSCPYILYVHGRPVAFAHGEQEYHPKNRSQSYGDALEATVASALRRCCKHLGIGLQLWDRRWARNFRAQHCVEVQVEVRKKTDDGWKTDTATQWRRKDDPALPGEKSTGRAPRREPDQEEHADIDKPISEQKRERFWRIARRVGRNEDDIKRWLKTCYNVTASAAITNRVYDKVVRQLEASGPLPTCAERQPGEDG